MDVRITDDYELRAVDSLNWQLYERREMTKGKRAGEVVWVGLPSYHRDLTSALRAVLARAPKAARCGELVDLPEALEVLRGLEKEIGEHARTFERALAEDEKKHRKGA